MRSPKIAIAVAAFALLIAGTITIILLNDGDKTNPTGTAPSAGKGSDASRDEYQVKFTELRRRQTTRMNTAVTACMADAGFKYVPVTPPINPRDSLTEREDLLEYGYGVNTAPVLPKLNDPNAPYVAALTAERRTAYRQALQGSTPSSRKSHQSGCIAASYNRHVRPLAAILSRAVTAREQMYEKLTADDRLMTARKAWSDCMAQSGYQYKTSFEISAKLAKERQDRGGQVSAQARTEELAIAKVDSACRDRHIDHAFQTVLAEYLAREAPANEKLLSEANQATAKAK